MGWSLTHWHAATTTTTTLQMHIQFQQRQGVMQMQLQRGAQQMQQQGASPKEIGEWQAVQDAAIQRDKAAFQTAWAQLQAQMQEAATELHALRFGGTPSSGGKRTPTHRAALGGPQGSRPGQPMTIIEHSSEDIPPPRPAVQQAAAVPAAIPVAKPIPSAAPAT